MAFGEGRSLSPTVWVVPIPVDVPLHRFTANEIEYCEQFRVERDRLARFAVRVVAKTIAHALLDHDAVVEVTHDAQNAPYFVDVPVAVSLAHTRDHVAVALSEHAIGVDIETFNRRVDFEAITRRFFSDAEKERVEIATEPRRDIFFELWTRKEAVLKAEGTGLTVPLKDVEFEGDRAVGFPYRITTQHHDEWVLSVASHDDPIVEIKTWETIAALQKALP